MVADCLQRINSGCAYVDILREQITTTAQYRTVMSVCPQLSLTTVPTTMAVTTSNETGNTGGKWPLWRREHARFLKMKEMREIPSDVLKRKLAGRYKTVDIRAGSSPKICQLESFEHSTQNKFIWWRGFQACAGFNSRINL